MSNNLPRENDQKGSETPQTESSLPPLSNTPDLPTSQVANPLPSLSNVQDLSQPQTTTPKEALPPLPDPSTVGTSKPNLPPLPLKEETQPIHMSVPITDLPVRKDGSIVMTLLILFMLLISGLGIYLYVAYTNLANQAVPSEINPVSYSQQ